MDAMMDVTADKTIPRPEDGGAVLLKGGTLGQAMERLTGLLQPGDLIFVERRGLLYRHVARATHSWASQVGLCLRDAEGNWVVYEAGVPMVRRVPLERFIRRTRGNRFAVRRLNVQPSDEQLVRLSQAAERCIGRFNGLGFNYDSSQMFGPKMIREVFAEAMGKELGQVVTMAELRAQLPAGSLWFWRIWYLGAIPWQRRTMTPGSLFNDPGLHTVFESF